MAFVENPGGIHHRTSSASRGTEARAPAKESGVVTVTPAPCPGAKPPTDESTTSSALTPSADTHRILDFVHAELSENKHCNDRPPPLQYFSTVFYTSICPSVIPTNILSNFPINVDCMATQLISYPDRSKVDYLITGLREGFHIGFQIINI